MSIPSGRVRSRDGTVGDVQIISTNVQQTRSVSQESTKSSMDGQISLWIAAAH